MNTARTLIATTVAAGVIGVPLAVVAASPASADSEKHGSCGRGHYELDVDREHGGYDVSFDIDGVRPGSDWRIRLAHDGKLITKKVRTADHEGEVELDRWRPDTKGKDAFRVKATNVNTGATCATKVVRR